MRDPGNEVGETNILTLPKMCTTSYGHNSFIYHGARSWNAPPNQYSAVTVFNTFVKFILSCNHLFALIFLSLYFISNTR